MFGWDIANITVVCPTLLALVFTGTLDSAAPAAVTVHVRSSRSSALWVYICCWSHREV